MSYVQLQLPLRDNDAIHGELELTPDLRASIDRILDACDDIEVGLETANAGQPHVEPLYGTSAESA